jgi:hypothetical protein
MEVGECTMEDVGEACRHLQSVGSVLWPCFIMVEVLVGAST